MANVYLTNSYFEVSKNIGYSIIFILPMLFIYELMCWVQYFDTPFQLRNGADVVIRQIFLKYGNSELFYNLALLSLCIIIIFCNRKVIQNESLKLKYLLFMIVESLIWTSAFVIFMATSESIMLSVFERGIIPRQFYLAIGAGIWEELLFRVGAVWGIISILKYAMGYSSMFSTFIAIIISAVIFSYFHYIGELGDIFTYRSFSLRVIAGIFLGSLYIIRGFGITAYTHIFYDMTIISLPVLMNNY